MTAYPNSSIIAVLTILGIFILLVQIQAVYRISVTNLQENKQQIEENLNAAVAQLLLIISKS
jgi:hypothetical protein